MDLKFVGLVLALANQLLALSLRVPRKAPQDIPKDVISMFHEQLLAPTEASMMPVQRLSKTEPDARDNLICLGDSITEGDPGSHAGSYTIAIQKQWPNLKVYNEGVGGDFAWHNVQRFKEVSDIVEQSKDKKNYIVIMVGTNNVMGSLNDKGKEKIYWTDEMNEELLVMVKAKHGEDAEEAVHSQMPKDRFPKFKSQNRGDKATEPTDENYQKHLSILVQKAKALGAKVAVMPIIPLGEDFSGQIPAASANEKFGALKDSPNAVTARYAKIARQIARNEGVDFLPLQKVFRQAIMEARQAKFGDKASSDEGAWTVGRATEAMHGNAMKTIDGVLGGGEPPALDSITVPSLTLLNDFIHPNEQGAAVIASVVDQWLQRVTKE